MKIDLDDLYRLRGRLLLAALMIVIGSGAGFYAQHTFRDAERLQQTTLAERNDIESRLFRMRSDEQQIRAQAALFQDLQARGVVGDEQRLDWIELLDAIRDRRRLIDLRYELSPQRPLDAAQGDGLGFQVSAMTLQLKLRHEEELLRVLDDLRQYAKALVHIRSCSLSRQADAALAAECRIDWVTLREGNRQ